MFLSQPLRILLMAAVMAMATAGLGAAASNVTYTTSGTFSTTVVNGPDHFRLAGQPFSISIVASEAAVPVKSGATWAEYNKLTLTGFVQSGLLPTPTMLSSNNAVIKMAVGNPNYDQFALYFPFIIVGTQFNVTAVIKAPKGTIASPVIGPFTAPVTLAPANTTVTYEYSSNGTPSSTTLTIAHGTLSTTVSGQGPAH